MEGVEETGKPNLMKSSLFGRLKKLKKDTGEDRANKAKTKTWSDVVKGMEEDESKTTDSVEESDMKETDPVKAEWPRRQPKPTSIWSNRRVEGRQRRDN